MSFIDSNALLNDSAGAGGALKQLNTALSLGKSIANGAAPGVAEQAIEILEKENADVQQMLAFELRLVENLPELVVKTIATSDNPSVSVPFLEVSPAVSEELLLAVMDDLHASAQTAVARRDDVTDAVAGALIDCGNEKAALSLARNDKVEISAAVLERIVAKFPDDARIIQSANRAISKAREFKSAESSNKNLPFNVLVSRARAFQKNGMLTSDYVVTLIDQSSVNEFEASLSVLSGEPRKDVRRMALSNDTTRVEMEQLCKLAPGALTSNFEAIRSMYTAQRNAVSG